MEQSFFGSFRGELPPYRVFKSQKTRLVQDGKPYRNEAMAQLQEDLLAAAAWERRAERKR